MVVSMGVSARINRTLVRALLIIGVMEPAKFKMMVTMSSDHAGIARELKWLEREIYRVVARVDDPRKVRDYLRHLESASQAWLLGNPHSAPWDKKK